MELYARVRQAVVVDKLSEREAARQFGLARETVRKMLHYPVPLYDRFPLAFLNDAIQNGGVSITPRRGLTNDLTYLVAYTGGAAYDDASFGNSRASWASAAIDVTIFAKESSNPPRGI